MSKVGIDPLLSIYLQEYQALKAEQTARIGFRDNLLYVTLVTVGGILSFSLANQNYYALLLIPWTCIILGWTYLANDEKITAIRRYIQSNLSIKIAHLVECQNANSMFTWETEHRSSPQIGRRKIEQLIIDELTFVASGLSSLIAFFTLTSKFSVLLLLIGGVEGLLLLCLGTEIAIYYNLAKRG